MTQAPTTPATPYRVRITASNETPLIGRSFAIDESVFIGRDPACRFALNEASVSRQHASLEPAPDGVRLVDLNSGNGVWMGTSQVKDVVLLPGQQFRIGSTVFECQGAPTPAQAGIRVRVVEGTEATPAGREFVLFGTTAIIGRQPECDVVLTEPDVSRRHASLALTADGLRITDLDSSCGIAVDGRDTKTALLQPGQLVRIGGAIVIECHVTGAVRIEPEPPTTADSDATRFITPQEYQAAIGKGAPAAAPAPSAKPASPAAPVPAPVPVAAAVGQHAPARPSLAAAPPASPPVEPEASDADFGHTVVIPVPQEFRLADWRFENEGEPVTLSPHRSFLIDDPESVWYVVSGGVLLFTVAVDKGEPVGARTHFLGILPGQLFCGFDLRRYGIASGFLAVPRQGTTARRLSRTRLRELSADVSRAPAVVGLIDAWITGLASALITPLSPKRSDETALKIGEPCQLGRDRKATVASGVAWVRVPSGSVLFDDMGAPRFTMRDVPFPVTPQSWIRPISDEFGDLVIRPQATIEVVGSEGFWHGLDAFHQVLAECEFIEKRLALADEYQRLQAKEQHKQQAKQSALDQIAQVMRSDGDTPDEFRVHSEAEPVLQACQIVGKMLGVEVRQHPLSDDSMTFEERMISIASASGYRTRVVALRDTWYTQDNGPLLGQRAEDKAPLALVPVGPTKYVAVDPKTNTRVPVDAKVARELSSFAYSFYRTFPEGALRAVDVVRFGARGLRPDLLWVFYMAIVVGLFGTVTPWITGQVFDSAIPGAQRQLLLGLGAALVVSAMASSAFKFTQGVATVRVQAKMAGSIQAAVWDRILNLPVNFFRKYSAGDLTDRADGVAAIQDLVSGAGVAAILGSVSGTFYIVQMFGFDLRLALLALLLTLIFVGTNMLANYLQLRHQRLEIQIRGRITGLVLNLLTGVTKLRVCGAENHAFRVWAEYFSRQRRIAFTVGTIQNLAEVFGTVFPVISSIAIFSVCVSLQAAAAEAGTPGLTTGDFIAFNSAYGLFLGAMQALGDASLSLLRVVPIYERLSPILTTAPEVDRSKAFPGKLTGRIELSHVYFRYTTDGPWIIKDASLKIEPGEFIAFVGSSGGGKSTLMRLMLGFEQATRGSVLYDNQDLNSLDLRQVRQQVGVVLQASRVMPTEIYRNITGATSRTIEDAWDAAEKSGLAEDIRNMPMGMHTYVSEGGGTLSGGQRQRMMIARAIVNKPKVLFLDEATSALDNRTQHTVTESMSKMDSTRIVIAHRLSTIVDADRIYFLHGGEIAEVGTYQELMDKNGLFAELAKRQLA